MFKKFFISLLLLNVLPLAAMDNGPGSARDLHRVDSFDDLEPLSKAELLKTEINGYINEGLELHQERILYYLHAGADPRIKVDGESCIELLPRIKKVLTQIQEKLSHLPTGESVDLVTQIELAARFDGKKPSIEKLASDAGMDVERFKKRIREEQRCCENGGLERLAQVESFIEATLAGRSLWLELRAESMQQKSAERDMKKFGNDACNHNRDGGHSPRKKRNILSFKAVGSIALVSAVVLYLFGRTNFFPSRKRAKS